MTTVEIGLIMRNPIKTIDIRQGVNRPQIPMFIGVFIRNIATVSISIFDDKILSQTLRLIQIKFIVREQLIPIDVSDLIKYLHKRFNIDRLLFVDAIIKPSNCVPSFLQTRSHGLTIE